MVVVSFFSEVQNVPSGSGGGEERADPRVRRGQRRKKSAAEGLAASHAFARNKRLTLHKVNTTTCGVCSQALAGLKGTTEEIPCVVGDEHVWTKDVRYQLSVSQQIRPPLLATSSTAKAGDLGPTRGGTNGFRDPVLACQRVME